LVAGPPLAGRQGWALTTAIKKAIKQNLINHYIIAFRFKFIAFCLLFLDCLIVFSPFKVFFLLFKFQSGRIIYTFYYYEKETVPANVDNNISTEDASDICIGIIVGDGVENKNDKTNISNNNDNTIQWIWY